MADTYAGIVGDSVGVELEQAFFNKAKEAGMTDEEAKNAFDSNIMATGLLSECPAEFARAHGRRWLVSAYEAGDVVLHKPHMVCVETLDPVVFFSIDLPLHFIDSCVDDQP